METRSNCAIRIWDKRGWIEQKAMRQRLLLATTLGLMALWLVCAPMRAHAAGNDTFDRTLTVNGPVTLHVSTGSGYIHVTPGSDNQVHITGHVKPGHSWFGGSADSVQQVVKNPPIEQAGNIIRVGGRHEDDAVRHVSIDYDVTTPVNTLLTAESGSGEIQLTNLAGTVKAGTGSGDIHVDQLGAGAKLETGSGTIDARNLKGGAMLQTGSGDIRAQFTGQGDVNAETGSGSIRLAGVQGGLKADTGSGDLEVNGQPSCTWKLETGSGSITLGLGNAHFTLDAETGSGAVKSDQAITMQGSLDKHHVRGTVNGGGPTIRAETGSGDIRIH